MNQAIHFPDLEQWDDERQSVCFPALVSGMCVECQVSAGWLNNRFATAAGDATPLARFRKRLDKALIKIPLRAAAVHPPA